MLQFSNQKSVQDPKEHSRIILHLNGLRKKCNLFDTLHKRGRINWTYSVIIFLSLSSSSQEPASGMEGSFLYTAMVISIDPALGTLKV